MSSSDMSAMVAQLEGLNSITPLTGLITPASMMAMAITFLALGFLLTAVRFVTRRMQKVRIGWDDWLIIPALVLMSAMCVNMIVAVSMQRFGYKLPPRVNSFGAPDPYFGWASQVVQSNMFEYVQEIIAPLQLAFTKLSIVFFYRRVLVTGTRGVFHWITIVVLVLIGVWGLGLALAFTFPCGTRFALYWNGPLIEVAQTCIGSWIEGVLIFSDIALDAIIMIMPIPKIFRLQLTLRKKLLVAAAFLVGALAIVVAAVRAVMLIAVLRQAQSTFVSNDEATEISYAMYWGMLESGLSIVVACLPALQYLITRDGPLQLVRTVTGGIRSVSRLGSARRNNNGGTGSSSTSNSTPRLGGGQSPRFPPPASPTPSTMSTSQVKLIRSGNAVFEPVSFSVGNRNIPAHVDVEKANSSMHYKATTATSSPAVITPARHIGLVPLKSPPLTPAAPTTPTAPNIVYTYANTTRTTITKVATPTARTDADLPPLPFSPRTPRTPRSPTTPMSAVSELSATQSVLFDPPPPPYHFHQPRPTTIAEEVYEQRYDAHAHKAYVDYGCGHGHDNTSSNYSNSGNNSNRWSFDYDGEKELVMDWI